MKYHVVNKPTIFGDWHVLYGPGDGTGTIVYRGHIEWQANVIAFACQAYVDTLCLVAIDAAGLALIDAATKQMRVCATTVEPLKFQTAIGTQGAPDV